MSALEEFAAALKNERRTARRTLRELAEASDRSIGYLSDVEQGRKLPPPPEVVCRIEQKLGIEDGRLSQLARDVRNLRPSVLIKMLANSSPARTQLVGELMRADGLTDEDIESLRKRVAQLQRTRNQCRG